MTDDTDNIVPFWELPQEMQNQLNELDALARPRLSYVWKPLFPSMELHYQLLAGYGDPDAPIQLLLLEMIKPQIDAYVAAWENDILYGSGTGGMHLLGADQ